MTAQKRSSKEILPALREQLRRIESAGRAQGNVHGDIVHGDILISSGSAVLDRLLPGGGFVRGQLVEWLAEGRGSGAGTLAMMVARQACCGGGALVVADRAGDFYPPAAAFWGVDLDRLIVMRARRAKEELWGLVQALGCPGVAAVWAPLGRLDSRSSRRLQLAAERGGGLGLLLRSASVRGHPSWSDMQLLVRPRPALWAQEGPSARRGRRLCVELLRCRGGIGGGSAVELEIDEVTGTIREAGATWQARAPSHETHPLYLAAQLAHPASGRCPVRA